MRHLLSLLVNGESESINLFFLRFELDRSICKNPKNLYLSKTLSLTSAIKEITVQGELDAARL